MSLSARQLARQSPCSTLRFEVVDTGIGIPPKQQSRIFEPFTEAENYATRRFGGTGLACPSCSAWAAS